MVTVAVMCSASGVVLNASVNTEHAPCTTVELNHTRRLP
jgi:hypothetical protein